MIPESLSEMNNLSIKLRRIDQPKTARVRFVGDEDVVENITAIIEKKIGKKKNDIIYEHLKAETKAEEESDEECYQPSTALFSEKNDVEGKDLFQVTPLRAIKKTPKVTTQEKKSTKQGVKPTEDKYICTRKSGKPIKSPTSIKRTNKDSGKKTVETSASRYQLRIKMKQVNKKEVAASDPENSDEDESWDDNSESGSAESGSGSDAEFTSSAVHTSKQKKDKSARTFAEDYFFAHKQSKAVTSNRTMSKVKLPQTNLEKLQNIIKNASEYHKKEKTSMLHRYDAMFEKWSLLLHEGFSVMLYGIGSKHGVLKNFCTKHLQDSMYLVIHGFFPTLTIKQILTSITEDVMNHDGAFSNIFEHAEFVKQHFMSGEEDLYIIIHNIDGTALRGTKTQSILSLLATTPGIHFLASVDHINCSLIWDQIMLSQFKWIWCDVTTFEPYVLETSYESSLLHEQSSHLLLSSLMHVYRSLTPNGCGVFLILAKYQMEKKDTGGYLGITFQDWYQECREAFLVNSELTMNAQLSEFKNHKLLSSRKSPDGLEYWYIPVDENTLNQFLEKEEKT